MAQRSRTTFAKRQKEQARQEKQRAKLQRRLEKKVSRQDADGADASGASESPENVDGPLPPLSSDPMTGINHNPDHTEEEQS